MRQALEAPEGGNAGSRLAQLPENATAAEKLKAQSLDLFDAASPQEAQKKLQEALKTLRLRCRNRNGPWSDPSTPQPSQPSPKRSSRRLPMPTRNTCPPFIIKAWPFCWVVPLKKPLSHGNIF